MGGTAGEGHRLDVDRRGQGADLGDLADLAERELAAGAVGFAVGLLAWHWVAGVALAMLGVWAVNRFWLRRQQAVFDRDGGAEVRALALVEAFSAAHPDWQLVAHVNGNSAWGAAKMAAEALQALATSNRAELRAATAGIEQAKAERDLQSGACGRVRIASPCVGDPLVATMHSADGTEREVNLGLLRRIV